MGRMEPFAPGIDWVRFPPRLPRLGGGPNTLDGCLHPPLPGNFASIH